MTAVAAAFLAIAASAGSLAQPARAPAGPAPPPDPAPGVRLAAVASGDDARAWILVGPAGQVYAPDGHGGWVRTQAGGIGNAVSVAMADPAAADGARGAGGATAARAGVLVGADGAPPYRFDGHAWSAVYLAMHAKAVVARGRRPVAAVGRQVFALDRAEPQRLADAPAAVTAIGASAGGVAIVTDRGVARLEGKAWRAVERVPRGVIALASERWALTADGAVDLKSGATTTWPRGEAVTAFVAADDTLLAAAQTGNGIDLFRVHGDKLAREAVAAAPSGVPVGIATDKDHRVVIALRDGRVLVRDRDTWTTATVRDELPADKPGAPPALAR